MIVTSNRGRDKWLVTFANPVALGGDLVGVAALVGIQLEHWLEPPHVEHVGGERGGAGVLDALIAVALGGPSRA